ncbi:MAG: Hint domain-containing protein [Pseudomonadota bacterium]
MPTTYQDQTIAGNFDPGFPPGLPTDVTIILVNIVDQNDDGIIQAGPPGTPFADRDTVNGSRITAVFNGDTVTLDGNVITGATIYTADGGRYFTPTDGTFLQDGTVSDVSFVVSNTSLSVNDLLPVCFTAGTLIETPQGPRPVEDLAVGELVLVCDGPAQPLVWVGRRRLPALGRAAPILIPKGAFGASADLIVSPWHRILVQDPTAQVLFGARQMLVPAKELVGRQGVRSCPGGEVDYVHVMCARHQILMAHGVASESFQPAQTALDAVEAEVRDELLALFPELRTDPNAITPARPALRAPESRLLVGSSPQ